MFLPLPLISNTAVFSGTTVSDNFQTITELYNEKADFSYNWKDWTKDVFNNKAADLRNHYISYGVESFEFNPYSDVVLTMKYYDMISVSLAEIVVQFLPLDFQYLGSTWFNPAAEHFATVLQLNLYSQSELNFYIEYFVTMGIMDYISPALDAFNVAKSGIVKAWGLPSQCDSKLFMSIKTDYEQTGSKIRTYQAELPGAMLCGEEAGKVK